MTTNDALYDRIGVGYDSTRRADPFIAGELARLLEVSAGKYLDLACGSGNYTTALERFGGQWWGVDLSPLMIERAGRKSPAITWNVAAAEQLPYQDQTFDGVACVQGIHHFPSLARAFAEVARVMKRGKFVLFTSTPEQIRGYWLAHYFPTTVSRAAEQRPSLERVQQALSKANLQFRRLQPYSVQNDLQDLFFYSGKFRPEIYLDDRVRQGISPFAALANPSEVSAGCRELRADIDSGRIADIIASDNRLGGDYCFIIAEKAV